MDQQVDYILGIMENDGTCHKIDHSTKNQSNDKSKQTNSNKLSSQPSSKATSNHAQPLSGYPGQIASQINPKPTNTSSSSKSAIKSASTEPKKQQNSDASQQKFQSQRSASPKRAKSDQPSKDSGVNPSHPLSPEDKERQKIADENHQLVKNHPNLVTKKGITIRDADHDKIKIKLKKVKSRFEDIVINNHSTIGSAIYYHKHGYKNIYILNFADAIKAGGGYLNGRNAQEECLCRQTLLYPTIIGNDMYKENAKLGPEGSDIMIYSPDVLVIRDDNYKWIKMNEQFRVNIISSPAVDNRSNIKNAEFLMEKRIRKIISLAASKSLEEKNQGKNVLILGAFGCGVFKNDPKLISNLFAKILIGENFKDYFNLTVFPIFKGSHETTQVFQNALKPVGKK